MAKCEVANKRCCQGTTDSSSSAIGQDEQESVLVA